MEDGALYELYDFAKCNRCGGWWKQRVQARYHVMNKAGEGLPYETGYGEFVQALSAWHESDAAGSSYAFWTGKECETKCPACSAVAAQMTLC